MLINLAHLERAYNFKLLFLQRFRKVKLLSVVKLRHFTLGIPSIKELLILMDFALKGNKNK